jgi:hypothetical protein
VQNFKDVTALEKGTNIDGNPARDPAASGFLPPLGRKIIPFHQLCSLHLDALSKSIGSALILLDA